jgi:hypothetical protein
LKCLALGESTRAAAADGDERASGEVCRGDTGDRIGMTGTARNKRQGRPASDARPRVGCVRDTRFVTHVDDLNSLPGGGGQHFIQMIADQSKNAVDPETHEGADE